MASQVIAFGKETPDAGFGFSGFVATLKNWVVKAVTGQKLPALSVLALSTFMTTHEVAFVHHGEVTTRIIIKDPFKNRLIDFTTRGIAVDEPVTVGNLLTKEQIAEVITFITENPVRATRVI